MVLLMMRRYDDVESWFTSAAQVLMRSSRTMGMQARIDKSGKYQSSSA